MGDNADKFPLDPNATTDTDADGIGDNSETDDGVSRTGWASLKFVDDEPGGSITGQRAAPVGDIDNDGVADFLVGPRVGEREYAFVLSGAALATLDAEDGNSDRFIELEPLRGPGEWVLHSPHWRSGFGAYPASIADALVNREVQVPAFVMIGAPWPANRDQPGTAYLLSGEHLAGSGREPGLDPNPSGVWHLVGEAGSDSAGEALAIADLDGDLTPDFLVTATWHSAGLSRAGAVYVFSSDAGSLDRLDGVDGSLDGLIDISHVGRTDGWKIDGTGHGEIRRVAVAGDVDGDSRDDLLITFWNQPGPGSAYLLLGSAFSSGDGDGASARTLDDVVAHTWRFVWEEQGDHGMSPTGDVDGDGLDDFVLSAESFGRIDPVTGQIPSGDEWQPGVAYLIVGADLDPLDAADGEVDRTVLLGKISGLRD